MRSGGAVEHLSSGGEDLAAVPSRGRANLVEGAPAPEADLTRALYEQYASQIFRYCLHQLGSREEAEDAVQSTFLNAFRGIKRGIVPELESAWLFKIAHNVCLSRRRSTWRRGRIEAPTDFEVIQDVAPAPARRADELVGLQDVLEQMPEQQRRAILLREWQGLSYREIGEELGLSQAAVETLIFRARRSLAQGLEEPDGSRRKRRRLHGAAFANLLTSAQSFLLGGGAAVKVAATVAVVSAGTVVATAPVHRPAPAKPVPHHVAVVASSHPVRAVAAPPQATTRRPPPSRAVVDTPRRATHRPAPVPARPAEPGPPSSPAAGGPVVAPDEPVEAAQAPAPQDVGPAPAPVAPAPAPPSHAVPAQAAAAQASAPGRQKQAEPPAAPADRPAPANAKRKADAPGRLKKSNSPADAAPVSAPAVAPPVQPEQTGADPAPADPAALDQAPAENGNDHGNGKAKGHDK